MLSAKFEEEPEDVPSLCNFTFFSKLSCKQHLVEAEKILLQTLGWNALAATHFQFAECFARLGVLFPSDKIRGAHWNQLDQRAVKAKIEHLSKLCAFGKSTKHLRHVQNID